MLFLKHCWFVIQLSFYENCHFKVVYKLKTPCREDKVVSLKRREKPCRDSKDPPTCCVHGPRRPFGHSFLLQ